MAKASILIVDDNPANLKLVQVILAMEGYEILSATNADEALALLQTRLPDLILMDIQLPGVDGLSLTRLLKTNPMTQQIPIVAISAYAMSGDEQKALDAGCDGYLPKPIDTRALPKIVASYLRPSP